ncbi:MAG: putative dsRNA-binding protein, partial [Anaerolineae bacterium]
LLDPLVTPEVAHILRDETHKDAKSLLQEMAQARMHRTPRYVTVGESGPDHAKIFAVQVKIGSEAYGEGHGPSKQQAAQAAAQEALERLEEEEEERFNNEDWLDL